MDGYCEEGKVNLSHTQSQKALEIDGRERKAPRRPEAAIVAWRL